MSMFFTPKTPFFGPSWTWNDTWIGHKSVPSIYSHCLRYVMAHYHVSRLNFSSNTASCHFGCFLPPKHPFPDPPGPGMTPGWGIKVSNTSFTIAWGVFWSIFLFPGGLLGWYGSLPSWSILTQMQALQWSPKFGTWSQMGPKSKFGPKKVPILHASPKFRVFKVFLGILGYLRVFFRVL